MTNRDERRFHLFDAMVLIAILALGWTAARAYVVDCLGYLRLGVSLTDSFWDCIDTLRYGGIPFALVWAVALVLIRVPALRHRHQRRCLCTQPGFTAALAVVACFAVVFLDSIARTLFLRVKSGVWGPWNVTKLALSDIHMLMVAAPSAVAATWLVLALGGRWRPERSWLDRTGLLLGVYWISWPIVPWLVALGA